MPLLNSVLCCTARGEECRSVSRGAANRQLGLFVGRCRGSASLTLLVDARCGSWYRSNHRAMSEGARIAGRGLPLEGERRKRRLAGDRS